MILTTEEATAFLAAVAPTDPVESIQGLSIVLKHDEESHIEARFGLVDDKSIEVRRYPHAEGREEVEKFDNPAGMADAYGVA